MTADEFDLLVSRWLAGDASDADEAALAERLKSSEDARLRFAELADQEAALRVVSQSMVQARQFREAEGAGTDTTRRIRTLARRRRKKSSESPWRVSWIAGTAAAFFFFAVVVIGSTSSPKPPPGPKRGPAEEVVRPPVAPPAAARVDRAKDLRVQLDRLARERQNSQAPEPPPPAEPRPEAPERPEPERPASEERRAPEPAPPRKPEESTRAVACTLDRVDGTAFVVSPGRRDPAQTGMAVLPGQGVETVGAESVVRLAYPDGTRVDLSGDGAIEGVFDREPAAPGKAARGKRLRLARGSLGAVVARQPPDQQMEFASPHGEARVLGTSLRILVGADATRLEVTEGKVRLTSASTKKGVDVLAGHFAVAAVGVELVARPLPIDEILLLPQQGASKIYGAEWRRVKDPRALTGQALDVPYRLGAGECEARFNKKSLGYVEFTFQADAGRDYHVWIRGCCRVELPKVEDRWGWDMVAIEVPNAKSETNLPDCLNATAYGYTGWAYRPGYWWVGGNADPKVEGAGPSEFPVTFRFDRPGRQVLRLYVYEAPLRVDAIWLSTTQKSRPDPDARGPKK
jgi:ferric-dicitrate binding protein FerR (iron transport regulator)